MRVPVIIARRLRLKVRVVAPPSRTFVALALADPLVIVVVAPMLLVHVDGAMLSHQFLGNPDKGQVLLQRRPDQELVILGDASVLQQLLRQDRVWQREIGVQVQHHLVPRPPSQGVARHALRSLSAQDAALSRAGLVELASLHLAPRHEVVLQLLQQVVNPLLAGQDVHLPHAPNRLKSWATKPVHQPQGQRTLFAKLFFRHALLSQLSEPHLEGVLSEA